MKRMLMVAFTLALGLMTLSAGELNMKGVLDRKVKGIDGKEVDLSQYNGKVVLIVNVASKCGYTKQYTQLQAVYDKYKEKGLVVLGFPCNQFGGQEPGTEEEIVKFCDSKFGVKFPLFSKIDVNGDAANDLYKDLRAAKKVEKISWNFEKFLVNKKGEVVGHYLSKVSPDAPDMVKAIEAELGK